MIENLIKTLQTDVSMIVLYSISARLAPVVILDITFNVTLRNLT